MLRLMGGQWPAKERVQKRHDQRNRSAALPPLSRGERLVSLSMALANQPFHQHLSGRAATEVACSNSLPAFLACLIQDRQEPRIGDLAWSLPLPERGLAPFDPGHQRILEHHSRYLPARV